MSKKVMIRILVWLFLILGLSFITYLNYQIFIVDSIKQELKSEEQNKLILERQLKLLDLKIKEYNEKIYEDNRYLLFIPEDINKTELTFDYVYTPLDKVNAILLDEPDIYLDITEMPSNINWSSNAYKNIKGIKVSIHFEIPFANLVTYIEELQNTVRCIYISEFEYVVPDNLSANTEVIMDYYLFYHE